MADQGLGSLPGYLDRFAGGFFVDVAGARTIGDAGGRSWETVTSVGAEVVISASLLWEGIDLMRLGVAVPLEISSRPTAYFRVGWSF
jgi:hypothetical protein